MSRPFGSVKPPNYCHHKATGQAYVTLNGKEIYLGRHGSPESRAAYDRIVGEFLQAGRQLPQDAQSTPALGMTVSTLLAAFWEHAKREYPAPATAPGKRPIGELGNFFDVLKPLRRLYGPTPAASFGPRALKAVRAEFVRLDWCRNTVNRQTARVKFVFKWGVANEMIPPSVYHALSAVAGLRRGRTDAKESEPVKPVAAHAVTATLPHLGRHVRAMVELQLATGARPGELCSMRTGDIDVSGNVWIYRPQQHKTAWHGHKREIRIGPRAQAVLQPFLKTDLTAPLFSPAEAEMERHRVQREIRKTPMTPSQMKRAERARRRKRQRPPENSYTVHSYRRAIARACKRADVDAWHPHRLRHSFATNIRRDFGPEAALILLGDRSTRMVDVYAERDTKVAEEIVTKIG